MPSRKGAHERSTSICYVEASERSSLLDNFEVVR